MKFVINKKWKIIIGITAFLLAIVIVLSCVLANLQYAKENFALFSEARSILLKNFDRVSISEKANLKREIDNTHPLNLVSYNGNGDILDLWKSIPQIQRPYTIILLVSGQVLLPNSETNLHNLQKWADTCEENAIPYCIQAVNGETHMEARLPIGYIEERFAKHQYFYGLNASELNAGVKLRGEAESDNTLYIMEMVKLCAKYGAYFIWIDTNLNYKNGIILEWFENNESFYSTFKQFSNNICMLVKESIADPASYGVMQGLWLSGLIGNWGVSSDFWHWKNDGYKSLFGEQDKYVGNEWEQAFSYPENMYVQSMMMAMSRGATCFSQESPNFSIIYNGKPIAGFEYAISPLLNRIIEDKIIIPTIDEVYFATSFAVLGKDNYSYANYNFKESNIYPENGNSGIVPLLPSNLRKSERRMFTDRGILLVDYKVSNKKFLEAVGTNDANTYLTNTGQYWYYLNNLENKKGTKYARFAPKYASAESFYIESEEHSSAIITDVKDGLKVYLSNYRTDKTNVIMRDSTEMEEYGGWANYIGRFLTLDNGGNPLGVSDTALRKTVIEVKGTYNGGAPEVVWNNKSNGMGENNRKYNITSNYNAETQVLRLKIEHNGIVDFDIKLDDSGKDYAVPRKSGIADNVEETNADTSVLKDLVKEKLTYNNYTYFSYLEYDKQFEKAVVMIEQNTYSQKQIDSVVKHLKQAKENLIDIKNETELLRHIMTKTNNSVLALAAYDSLIREILSCQKYVSGRNNDLKYASIYRNKDINKTFDSKRKAINKAYSELVIYR